MEKQRIAPAVNGKIFLQDAILQGRMPQAERVKDAGQQAEKSFLLLNEAEREKDLPKDQSRSVAKECE